MQVAIKVPIETVLLVAGDKETGEGKACSEPKREKDRREWGECVIVKAKELADIMKRRKVDILRLEETRWKGTMARQMRSSKSLSGL